MQYALEFDDVVTYSTSQEERDRLELGNRVGQWLSAFDSADMAVLALV